MATTPVFVFASVLVADAGLGAGFACRVITELFTGFAAGMGGEAAGSFVRAVTGGLDFIARTGAGATVPFGLGFALGAGPG